MDYLFLHLYEIVYFGSHTNEILFILIPHVGKLDGHTYFYIGTILSTFEALVIFFLLQDLLNTLKLKEDAEKKYCKEI